MFTYAAIAKYILQLLTWLTDKLDRVEIKADGAREARQDSLEQDHSNTRRANEIDTEVGTTVIDNLDERDRLHQRD